MTLAATIEAELKAAMLKRDQLRTETLRSIRARLLEFAKSGAGREINEEEEQQILLKEAKKRKEASEQYHTAGRADLAEKERAELAIIQEFLPAQLSEAEITALVRDIIARLGAQGPAPFGAVMGAAMKELRGKAEGSTVQSIVKSLLA